MTSRKNTKAEPNLDGMERRDKNEGILGKDNFTYKIYRPDVWPCIRTSTPTPQITGRERKGYSLNY